MQPRIQINTSTIINLGIEAAFVLCYALFELNDLNNQIRYSDKAIRLDLCEDELELTNKVKLPIKLLLPILSKHKQARAIEALVSNGYIKCSYEDYPSTRTLEIIKGEKETEKEAKSSKFLDRLDRLDRLDKS